MMQSLKVKGEEGGYFCCDFGRVDGAGEAPFRVNDVNELPERLRNNAHIRSMARTECHCGCNACIFVAILSSSGRVQALPTLDVLRSRLPQRFHG